MWRKKEGRETGRRLDESDGACPRRCSARGPGKGQHGETSSAGIWLLTLNQLTCSGNAKKIKNTPAHC